MKNKLRCLYIALALLAGIRQAAAQIPVFPIATDPAVITYSEGFAFDGMASGC